MRSKVTLQSDAYKTHAQFHAALRGPDSAFITIKQYAASRAHRGTAAPRKSKSTAKSTAPAGLPERKVAVAVSIRGQGVRGAQEQPAERRISAAT